MLLVPCRGQAEVISVKDGLKRLHLVQELTQPTCAAFQSMTRRNVALGTLTGQVLIYDMKTSAVKKKYPKSASTVFRVEYTYKDTHLIAATENEVLLYSSLHSTLCASYKIPNSRIVSTVRCHQYKR